MTVTGNFAAFDQATFNGGDLVNQQFSQVSEMSVDRVAVQTTPTAIRSVSPRVWGRIGVTTVDRIGGADGSGGSSSRRTMAARTAARLAMAACGSTVIASTLSMVNSPLRSVPNWPVASARHCWQ